MNWRVIDTGFGDPYYVTAVDEVLALSRRELERVDTLHFYSRDPPGVSVGYFRKIRDDVDVDACQELGIKIVRRGSGGGSIYTDKNQLIYSISTSHAMGKNIESTFNEVCECIITALRKIDIEAIFKPPNDILLNGKKISGTALVKKGEVYLIHGTLISALDHDVIGRVLKKHEPGQVSSIFDEIGVKPDLAVLKQAIINAFSERFGIKFLCGELTEKENSLVNELFKNKYSTTSWNFKR